jgi:sugar phosphate isomerase/epimerase
MKLAVFTDEVSQDLDIAIGLAVRFGCQAVEIRSVWSTPVQELSSEQVRRIREKLEAANLRCCAIASPVFKCELDDPAAQKEHLEFLRRSIHTGHELGTSIVRIFAFWRHGPSEPVWERVRDQFTSAIPVAEEHGAILGIENEASTYSGTAAEVRRLIEELKSPVLRSVWDPCNEVYAEGGLTPYPDAYRLVEPWIVHVHIKDAKRDPEPDVVCVGEGIIDWPGQLRELKSKGYNGYLSLETHWRPVALTEEQMNRPGGAAFSEAGEYASEMCMRNLVAMLAEIDR